MQSRANLFIIFMLVCFVSSVSLGFSRKAPPLEEKPVPQESIQREPEPEETVPERTILEEPAEEPAFEKPASQELVLEEPVSKETTEGPAPEQSVSGAGTAEADFPAFPYVAEITGNNVNIRSGPGTDKYICGRLNKTDKVTVVSHETVWSCIVPPAGSFSWISTRYVSIDPNHSDIGIITAELARIWAGSEQVEPMHSESLQKKLRIGDKVRLLGEQKDDYYKIVPPTGAYLWVFSKYTKPLGPVGEVPPGSESQPEPKSAVAPIRISVEDEKLKEYRALEKQIEAERVKPAVQQNYTNIKKSLVEIANNKEAGKAARYCQFTIKQIKRFELASAVVKAVQLQDEQLQQIRDRIERMRITKLAEVQDLGRFAVIGLFKTLTIYYPEPQTRRYQVLDDSGKILCLAVPSASASGMNLSKFIGRKVGLVGTIEPHPQTKGAMVRFTEITQLK